MNMKSICLQSLADQTMDIRWTFLVNNALIIANWINYKYDVHWTFLANKQHIITDWADHGSQDLPVKQHFKYYVILTDWPWCPLDFPGKQNTIRWTLTGQSDHGRLVCWTFLGNNTLIITDWSVHRSPLDFLRNSKLLVIDVTLYKCQLDIPSKQHSISNSISYY